MKALRRAGYRGCDMILALIVSAPLLLLGSVAGNGGASADSGCKVDMDAV
jgi:hypothetical protein